MKTMNPKLVVLKNAVYDAAKDGHFTRLKTFLEPRPHDEVVEVVSAKTNGATPLIMACRNGHNMVVEYIIDECGADIEQVGSVTFDGETIEVAPPLWCAAAAGYEDIVKFLIKRGACVNNTTLTNSTPLRAACFNGHFEIVKYLVDCKADIEIANRHGHTCLMISCYKGHSKIVKYLIDKGADVNRKSLKGNTALHGCAESGSLEILKLLLACKATMEKDSYGMTPLLAAAFTGHTKIVEFLISRNESERIQKIDALELLGATYVDKTRDMIGALRYWKLAMQERFSDRFNVIEKPFDKAPNAAYKNAVEVKTMDELDELISDPDDMRMQALLVRERILGPAHPDTSYYIRYRGAVYAEMGSFDRCIVLWMYALDMQQKTLEPLSPMAQSSFLSFAELFSFMMTEKGRRIAQAVDFDDIMNIFNRAVCELNKGRAVIAMTPSTERDLTHFNRLLKIIMHLISLMCQIQERFSEKQVFEFKSTAYRLVKLNPRGARGFTLLHLACDTETSTVGQYPVCAFPSTDVANLLMEVGASVDAMDLYNNTPLHIAAKNTKTSTSDIMTSLLEAGAHVDACNSDRKTARDLLAHKDNQIISPLNYQTLQCLAATVIVANDIPYKGNVPKNLEPFVAMH